MSWLDRKGEVKRHFVTQGGGLVLRRLFSDEGG